MSFSLDDVVIPSTPCPPARCSVEQWEAEAAGLDYMKGDWSELAVEAAEARCEYQHDRRGRYAGYEQVHALAMKGVAFGQIARIVRDSVENVARLFCQADSDVPKFIKAEQILRTEGCPSQAEVARRSDLTRNQIQLLCGQLGIRSDYHGDMAQGGGRVITAEQYAEIKRLREQGASAAQIGRAVGIKANTATRICTRNGWVKGEVSA